MERAGGLNARHEDELVSARASPPPCGEGLGVGVAQEEPQRSILHHPHPGRANSRLDPPAGLRPLHKGEGSALGRPDSPVRLWLRLLTCTNLIEGEIRRRLRAGFGVTLPRFDLLAQLDREPDGLTLSAISRRMMVSNGNVTGLVERLARSGHVERRASTTDRRAQVISLTALGRAEFAAMAAAHRGWLSEMFAALGSSGSNDLMRLLARTKGSVRRAGLETTP